MVAYGREKIRPGFLEKKLLSTPPLFKGLFYPLQKAIEKYAGISFDRFRKNALDYFDQQVKKAPTDDAAAIYAREHKHFAADEEFPQFMDNDNIVFMRSTYKKIPAFVIRNISSGSERVVKTRSISLDNYFSYRNGNIVYAAYEPDIRWGWRDYSVLRVLNVETGEDRSISSRTKYFSPDISANGNRIVAVQVDVNGHSELHILDAANGSIEKVIPNTEKLFYTYPKFYNDSQVVAAVRNQEGKMALGLYNINDGSAKYLTPFSMQPAAFPSVMHDTIYFNTSHNGYDQLFAAANDHLYKMLVPGDNVSTGNYQLQAMDGKYVWTSFTAVGYTMFHAGRNAVQLQEISSGEWTAPLVTQDIHSLGKGPADLLDSISYTSYPIKKYSSAYKLFNFHSWRPYITDPDYSLSLVSENVLSTLQSELYIDYNRNEHYKQIGADATYAQLVSLDRCGS